MAQFIEVTDKTGKRNAVNVETIRMLIEYKDGGCFIVTSEEPKRGWFGFETQEKYNIVMAMIKGEI